MTVSVSAGQGRAGDREETLETASIPQRTGAARSAGRTSRPTTGALPPPARPPVTGGQCNVTSRDSGRVAPFGGAHAPWACGCPRKSAPANCGGGGRATGGKRVWSRLPGRRGLGPTWKGGDREGRLSFPAEGSWCSGGRQEGCTAAAQDGPASGAVGTPESFAQGGGFSYWLRCLNGMEARS